MAETRKNMVWINNGIQNKFINKNELLNYLENGWKRGRKNATRNI